MTDTTTGGPSPRMKPWLRLVLFVSLALNLAAAGLFAGAMVRHDDPDKARSVRASDLGLAYVRALDRDDRRALRDAIRADVASTTASRDPRAEFAEVLALLRADPFDPDAIAAQLRAQSADQRRRQEIGRRHLVDRIAAMTPAERAAFASRLEEGIAHQAERHSERHKPKGAIKP